MLSILIPVKDFNCSRLIEALHKQGEALECKFEIIIAEDGTEKSNLHLNTIADTLTNSRRIIKNTNIGRAAIRNLLAAEAQYTNLIFIDCDAVVEKDDFLKTYNAELKGHKVVCGGSTVIYH